MLYNSFYLIINGAVAAFFFLIIKYLNKNYLKIEENNNRIDSLQEHLSIQEAIVNIKTKLIIENSLSIEDIDTISDKESFINNKLHEQYLKERELLKFHIHYNLPNKTGSEVEQIINHYYPVSSDAKNDYSKIIS